MIRYGEVVKLGNHRLMCGDSTLKEHLDRLIDDSIIDVVFSDPPYGVSLDTNYKEKGRGNLCECHDYPKVIGDESILTAETSFKICQEYKFSLQIFWGANYYTQFLPPTSSWIIWDKRDGSGHNDNADCEIAWTNRGGPARVYRHMWNGALKASEQSKSRIHPTQKPIALAEYCINEYPKGPVETVLDMFGGGGSTMMACERLGKRFLMMELSPEYCEIIIHRFKNFRTGKITDHWQMEQDKS